MQKQVIFKTKGMQRDLSVSAFNSEYSYENKNIRIMSTDDNTLLSIINEKGNKLITINGIDTIIGTPIGQAVIENELVIFTAGNRDKKELDTIYKITLIDNTFNGIKLYEGDLNFNVKHPIETIPLYENSSIKKIYWTDGLNQPRVINIAATEEERNKWSKDSFNFVRTLQLKESIEIKRNIVANGGFAPGVIQYSFTYFSKYNQESNIFYTSPLYYISYNNRGASPEDKVGNSFTITIKDVDNNIDKNFDYIRVYSIHRTSIDATPTAKRVIDLAIPNTKTDITYTDNGTSGDIIDPVELLYIGGEEVVFGTMTHKDNTLFLGDITIKRKLIDSTIRDYFKEKNIEFSSIPFYNNRHLKSPNPIGFYPYNNQLKLNSYEFKTFKYLETYRLGVQFQHISGKWSEPIWINDVKNTQHIRCNYTKGEDIYLPTATFNITDSSIIDRLKSQGYIKARPVIVYPTLTDRECVCQGILCPTVYNVNDRFGNSPFAQSSWFVRPNAPFDINKTTKYNRRIKFYSSNTVNPSAKGCVYIIPKYQSKEILITEVNGATLSGFITNDDLSPIPNNVGTLTLKEGSGPASIPYIKLSEEYGGDFNDRNNNMWGTSENSRAGVINVNKILINNDTIIDTINKGAWAEFRHNKPIPSNDDRRAEIQCICNPPINPYIEKIKSNSDITGWVSQNSENFYIDQSILTFHSPDIEFDTNIRSIDTSGLKLRIVGFVPLTSFVGDIDIQTSTPPNNYKDSTDIAPGFYKEPIESKNISRFGFRGLMSGAFWFDELNEYKKDTGNTNHYTTGFVVYPWHRNGSLNNTKFSKDGYKSAMLDKKKLSNMRFSYNSYYFDTNNIWSAYEENDTLKTGISGISIFDSNEISLVRIPSPKNSELPDINYYGNIDKVLNIPRIGNKKDGYPIITTGVQNADTNAHKLFSGNYIKLDNTFTNQITGTDPVRMKYKSTPHAVLALNYSIDKRVRILPTLFDGDFTPSESNRWEINNETTDIPTDYKLYYEDKKIAKGISQDTINVFIDRNINNSSLGLGPEYGWLWLGELYNDNVVNRFGGKTEEAFENNQWLPCGESVSLLDNSVVLTWTEGDTYYQRYDHIKTYPFTLEDQNAITDIVSFMCETRINLDGRYDRNRGQTSNFTVNPTNFNLMNNVYSQQNNFFNYRTVNPNKINLDNFHNSITWTKTKNVGELIDTWTNITLASTLDLDGDKGSIRALKKLNNNIIAFQDKGISQILYNENVQISSTEGVPIEIANSGKVTGKRYLSDKIGCTNKWSICESPNGLYFIDDIGKDIYLFNGKLDNISDRFGFHSWVNKVSKEVNIWNPENFNNCVTYYDKVNGDIFFVTKDECLAFSEPLGQFTSFYSYEHMPYFTNIQDKGISINNTKKDLNYKLWLHNEGDYNMFFGKYQPFYTTVIVNPDVTKDKIFNTLEFRADSWKDNNLLNTTFDKLEVWNEYQSGEASLNNILGRPSNLKKKFRIWRANIPRDKSNNMDRMRNPWLYLKLSMDKENVDKTILHDMVISYFE